MDVKWLDDFLVLAECLSFTRAARTRHTSQSGLSRRIQSLEQWTGVQLIDRETHPMRLTDAGLRFLPVATNLRSAVMAARHHCSVGSAQCEAPVTLAVAEGLESGVLAGLLSRLQAQGFRTPVRVVVKDVDAASLALLNGDVDMWLAPQYGQLPLLLDSAAFDVITVAQDRLSPIVGVDAHTGLPLHALPGRKEAPTPMLEHGMSNYLARVVSVLMAAAPVRAHLRQACAADSLHSLRALVRQGLGVAFLPESMVREELQRGELALVDSRFSGLLEVLLIRAERSVASPAAHRLWQCLEPAAHGKGRGALTRRLVAELARPCHVPLQMR